MIKIRPTAAALARAMALAPVLPAQTTVAAGGLPQRYPGEAESSDLMEIGGFMGDLNPPDFHRPAPDC